MAWISTLQRFTYGTGPVRMLFEIFATEIEEPEV
jgi:hypothetical protein